MKEYVDNIYTEDYILYIKDILKINKSTLLITHN
jgi:hypothetical protein